MLAEETPTRFIAFDLLARRRRVAARAAPARAPRPARAAGRRRPSTSRPPSEDPAEAAAVAAGRRGRDRQAPGRAVPAGRARRDGEDQARAHDRRGRARLAARQGGGHARLAHPRRSTTPTASLREVGHTSGFTAKQKRELPAFLAPYETGERGSGEPSRWNAARELERRRRCGRSSSSRSPSTTPATSASATARSSCAGATTRSRASARWTSSRAERLAVHTRDDPPGLGGAAPAAGGRASGRPPSRRCGRRQRVGAERGLLGRLRVVEKTNQPSSASVALADDDPALPVGRGVLEAARDDLLAVGAASWPPSTSPAAARNATPPGLILNPIGFCYFGLSMNKFERTKPEKDGLDVFPALMRAAEVGWEIARRRRPHARSSGTGSTRTTRRTATSCCASKVVQGMLTADQAEVMAGDRRGLRPRDHRLHDAPVLPDPLDHARRGPRDLRAPRDGRADDVRRLRRHHPQRRRLHARRHRPRRRSSTATPPPRRSTSTSSTTSSTRTSRASTRSRSRAAARTARAA